MTTYANSLLALVGAAAPVGYEGDGGDMLVDHINDVAYFAEWAGVVPAGIKRFTCGAVGTEDAQVTEVDLYAGVHTLGQVYCFHPIVGDLFAGIDAITNSRAIGRIHGNPFSSVEVFGAASASLSHSTNFDPAVGGPRVIASSQMIPCWTGNAQYIVSNSITREVCVLEVTAGMSVVYAQDVTDEAKNLCPGKNGAADAYFLIAGHTSLNLGTTAINLYRFAPPAGGPTLIRSLAAGDIDATWTNFGIGGLGFDQSDEGILAIFFTGDAVAHQQYLVKFAKDGTLRWKTPIALRSWDLPQCSINRVLAGYCIITDNFCAVFDLRDGSVTEIEFNHGLLRLLNQVFNWKLGSVTGVLFTGSYAQGAGPVPTYLGDYLATHANAIPNDRWLRAYFGAFPVGNARSYAEVV